MCRDTGAMTGHAPSLTTKAIVEQIPKGVTFMLPGEDSIIVGEELKKRFGMAYWQIAMTATDANRFVIRLCRHITNRKKILIFNWAYHGTVDETFATLHPDGVTRPRAGNVGFGVDPTVTTKVIEFNDLPALEAALKDRDVACVLAEPAMTNIGIIHPQQGYWERAQKIIKDAGTLLIIDETHTICTGPGGYTAEHGLKPDAFVIGKPIGSGIPCAAYGFSESVSTMINNKTDKDTIDTSGIGGTLTGNALALAAMKMTLQNLLTKAEFEKTIPLAVRFTDGVQKVIDEYKLPWSITRLGSRAEYWFRATRPVNGGEAAAASDVELDTFMHLYCLNRGILMTPFHSMALICPGTTVADIDHHTSVFRSAVQELLGVSKSKL